MKFEYEIIGVDMVTGIAEVLYKSVDDPSLVPVALKVDTALDNPYDSIEDKIAELAPLDFFTKQQDLKTKPATIAVGAKGKVDKYPDTTAGWEADPVPFDPPVGNGETLSQVTLRRDQMIADLEKRIAALEQQLGVKK